MLIMAGSGAFTDATTDGLGGLSWSGVGLALFRRTDAPTYSNDRWTHESSVTFRLSHDERLTTQEEQTLGGDNFVRATRGVRHALSRLPLYPWCSHLCTVNNAFTPSNAG